MARTANGSSDLLAVRSNTDLAKLGKALRESGDKVMRREVLKAIQTATKPIKGEIAQSARQTLPAENGLAEMVAELLIVTKVNLSGRQIGVKIISSRSKVQHQKVRRAAVARRQGRKRAPRGTKVNAGYIDLNALDRGRGRHPTYGHRPMVIQKMRPGFFTRPMTSFVAVRTRRLIVDAIGVYLQELARAGSKAA